MSKRPAKKATKKKAPEMSTEAIAAVSGGDHTAAANQRIAQIVNEAAKLFDKVGYHNANMEMVAKATGLRKPTLYHYVKSKDEILLRIHQVLIEALNAQHKARVEQGLSREELLYGICLDIMNFIAENRGYVRAFFEHYRELSEPIRKQIREKRRAYFEMVSNLIAEGVAAGEYETDDVRLSTLMLLAQVNWAYQWYRPDGSLPPAAVARCALDIFLYGLAKKRPPRSIGHRSAPRSTRRQKVGSPVARAGG